MEWRRGPPAEWRDNPNPATGAAENRPARPASLRLNEERDGRHLAGLEILDFDARDPEEGEVRIVGAGLELFQE